ncbi:hypothetical protein WA026_000981 [Henosepilachna vigintioctopunctata]|uniref:Nucleolar protein 10 n=1 Tax=Henosepilachna vigintioctopunctata TaxID=420089 RepID=A0AAW1V6Z8_9CUCU
MQVSDANNVKIYNLSAGKSLPEWLSERKRRALLKKDVDLRRRIQLIQDFDMPGLSSCVRVSRDGDYILSTGIYKPRVKCFDVNNLSQKFERCFDSEAITFEILSDDYSKLVFLQCDRYIEFHVAHGRLHRLRIPKFGRDMKYHYPSAELYVVGVSPEIYRLNLERGQFMSPLTSEASVINKCTINPYHHLVVCGTQEGWVEAWDPRSKEIVGKLDCAFSCVNENKRLEQFPSITSLQFDGASHLGVGTSTGQILLYDIRSSKPYLVKDHMEETAIKDIDFSNKQNLVFSMSKSILKIWDKNTAKQYTSIEASTEFNNLCIVPDTGLLFIANENTKIQTYYIPSVGPAPKWAGFLDSLTEELEESNVENVYDDYKFVTKQELEGLGLEHLIGTNLLRAYMHGYFMDVRLYRKAKSVADPFAFEEYRKRKIRETIEKNRENIVQVDKLPKVNKELALKLMENNPKDKKKKDMQTNLLSDNRFKDLFTNADFEIDKNTDEYRLLNPVLSKLDKSKQKELKQMTLEQVQDDELEGKNSSDEESSDESDDQNDESSDDDMVWTKEVKKQHKLIKREHKMQERMEEQEMEMEYEDKTSKQRELIELRPGEEFSEADKRKKKLREAPLGERLNTDDANVKFIGSIGNRELTFATKRRNTYRTSELKNKKHREERRALVRSTKGINFKKNRNFS